MKLGIGVPTYNRAASLKRCLDSISHYASEPFVGVVADDGSTDETKDITHPDFTFLHCENGGIARNKNRLLYRLFEIEKCDVVLLIEDDVYAACQGVFSPWIISSLRMGHVNTFLSDRMEKISGIGNCTYPAVSNNVTAQIQGFSALCHKRIGYMDANFTGYGYEHCEHSRRAVRYEFGGYEENEQTFFYLLKPYGFILNEEIKTTGSEEKISESWNFFKDMHHDTGYKHPWLNEADRIKFLSEVAP